MTSLLPIDPPDLWDEGELEPDEIACACGCYFDPDAPALVALHAECERVFGDDEVVDAEAAAGAHR